MQIIVSGDQDILRLISPAIKDDTIYKRSMYLLSQNTYDGTLLLNVLTGAVVLLSLEEKAIFDRLPTIIGKQMIELVRQGFIVPESFCESKRVTQLRAIFRKKNEAEGIINHYNILPTTDCNARCFYCYQSDIKHCSMTKETADELVDYIVAHHGGQKVRLSWFGGEPTLAKNRIDYICKNLNALGIEFVSDIISNGYLFDEGFIKHAKNIWNLKSIQITLDGTEDLYNRVKAYVNIKDNAYQRVLRNIKIFLDEKIAVAIRLNMDTHNYLDLETLIDELSEKFKGEKIFSVYIRTLNENDGFAPIEHNEDDVRFLRRKFLEMQNKLESLGWPQIRAVQLPKLSCYTCMADNPNIIQCTPDGILGKCEDNIYEHTIGTLKEGINNFNEINRWKELAYYDSCDNCVLFPSCKHILKNCPFRPTECFLPEKNKTIDLYYKNMFKEYEIWKNLSDS